MTRWILIGLLGLIWMLPGCAFVNYGHKIAEDEATWIPIGVTTRKEIVARFGPPNRRYNPPGVPVPGMMGSSLMTVRTERPELDEDGTKKTVRYHFYKSEYFFFIAFSDSGAFWVAYNDNDTVQAFGWQ